jgi:hypothetical protein
MRSEAEQSVDRLVKQLVGSTKRIIIAFDGTGIYFRETLCVTHDGVSGESRYDTKPVGSMKHPRKFRKALLKLIEKYR